MATVIALWPNNTTSVLVMESNWRPIDLFYELDHIGDPLQAKIWVVKRRLGESVHATTDWRKCRLPNMPAIDVSATVDAANCDSQWLGPRTKGLKVSIAGDQGSVRRFKFPSGILRNFLFASWKDRVNQEPLRQAFVSDECGKMLAELPAIPAPMYSAKELNKMEPFAGVYVSWNEDGTAHYVGESVNVPSRVQASRPEIGTRMLGVVRCDRNQRKRIESLFIGLLNPAGNHQSSERAALRESLGRRRCVDKAG